MSIRRLFILANTAGAAVNAFFLAINLWTGCVLWPLNLTAMLLSAGAAIWCWTWPK